MQNAINNRYQGIVSLKQTSFFSVVFSPFLHSMGLFCTLDSVKAVRNWKSQWISSEKPILSDIVKTRQKFKRKGGACRTIAPFPLSSHVFSVILGTACETTPIRITEASMWSFIYQCQHFPRFHGVNLGRSLVQFPHYFTQKWPPNYYFRATKIHISLPLSFRVPFYHPLAKTSSWRSENLHRITYSFEN